MYRLYVIDFDGASIELDTEDLDFGLELRISNLSDLSLRSGSRTKEISIKGTDRNNNAFGYIYRLNRLSNLNIDNKLFFNYNSLRPVDCLIYDETNLIFRGTLRLTETIRVRGFIYYRGVITDSVIDLMKITQEKLLTDLNLNDLKHRYNIDNIVRSWNSSTERFISNTFSQVPFSLGSGYVYPYAYYGLTPSPTIASDNLYNYRPAVFVTEIFDRIFAQPGLTGFSWELKTNTDLSEKFKSLIVPNNQERLSAVVTNFRQTLQRGTGTMSTHYNFGITGSYLYGLYPINQYLLDMYVNTVTGSNTDVAILTTQDPAKAIWKIASRVECDASLEAKWTFSNFYGNTTLIFDVSERIEESNFLATSGWQSIASTQILLATASATFSGTSQIYIPKRTWEAGKQVALRVTVNGYDYTRAPNATASFTIPFNNTGNLAIDVLYDNEVIPALPENVKQYDFMKSIMLIFNLYAYTEKSRPKHIIFQTYDEFYAFANPLYIKQLALDWSNKILYNEDWKKTFNLTIPKSYTYTFKDDRDYINTDYKNQFNSVYGQLKFSDIYGVQDEKKVEPIFSPSPLTQYNDKNFPTIRGGTDTELRQTSTNIRLQFYNGIKDTTPYNLFYNQTQLISTIGQYGEQSEYYRPGLTANEVLQFGVPRKLYFPRGTELVTTPNLYARYHIGQITDLTSEDLYTIECRAILTSVDIGNFNFRTPVYLTTDIGNSYYKVLEIDWKDAKTPARIKLQAVVYEAREPAVEVTTSTTTTTTTLSNFVRNTVITVTKPGYIKYDDSQGVTRFLYIVSMGNYTLTDCHLCSSIRPAFPFTDLATWSNIVCGTNC